MNNTTLRTLLVYAVTLPLAVFVGWMVAGDLTRTSFAVLAAIVFVLLLPLLLKWHYPVMVFSWGTFITIFFLPGQPALWMLMAGINFGMAILNRIISKKQTFLSTPSITASLLVFAAVVILTAKLRGGFGMQVLGSATYGGKSYYLIIAGILGYFALASHAIPIERAKFYTALFFLPGIIAGVSNLIYFAGPSFYSLYLIFPIGFAGVQAGSEMAGDISRVAGFTASATAISFYLLAVSGIRNLFVKWWRLLLLIAVVGIGCLGGYRSILVLIGLTFVILFLVEGLLRSPLFPLLLAVGGLGFALLIPLASKLPMSAQRTLSFLPLKVDPSVRIDAQASINWRLDIWRAVSADWRKYFWLGKGYALNPTDLYLADQAWRHRRSAPHDAAVSAGNYHSGPLSVYVPFGVWGSLAFLAFAAVSLRALYLNYRYGREELRTINRFMFACFLGRLIFFFGAFGALATDFYLFTGLVGFSVALNKGICRKPVLAPQPVTFRGRIDLDNTQPRVPWPQPG